MFKLDVRQSVLVDLTTVSTNYEAVWSCGYRADVVCGRDLRFFILFEIIDLVWIRNLLDMKHVLFARLLFLLLLEGGELGVLRTVLPVVDNVFTGNNHVSLVNGNILRFDCHGLGVDGASDCIAEKELPLSLGLFYASDEQAVFATGNNLLQSPYVLDMLLIDVDVPEDDAHVCALGLLKGKDEGVVEVGPLVLGLDVRKEDVRVDC